MVMANAINFLWAKLDCSFWIKVVHALESMIFTSALLLCIVGVSLANDGLFRAAVMLMFAALWYLMSALWYSVVIFIIAFFLGPRFEISLSQSLAITNGDLSKIIGYPIALALLALAAVSVWWLSHTAAQREVGSAVESLNRTD